MWSLIKERKGDVMFALILVGALGSFVVFIGVKISNEQEEQNRIMKKERQIKKIEPPSETGCIYEVRRVDRVKTDLTEDPNSMENRRLERYIRRGFDIHVNPYQCTMTDCEEWILKKKVCDRKQGRQSR